MRMVSGNSREALDHAHSPNADNPVATLNDLPAEATPYVDRDNPGADGLLTAEDKAVIDSLGTAADNDDEDFATAAQGGKADTALQAADVDDAPVDGVTTAPVSSNWAFDHEASTSAHGIGTPAKLLPDWTGFLEGASLKLVSGVPAWVNPT